MQRFTDRNVKDGIDLAWKYETGGEYGSVFLLDVRPKLFERDLVGHGHSLASSNTVPEPPRCRENTSTLSNDKGNAHWARSSGRT